jgi:hypothetical protein
MSRKLPHKKNLKKIKKAHFLSNIVSATGSSEAVIFKHPAGLSDLSVIEDGADVRILKKIGERAAVNAINENKALSLPLTYEKDGWVVREYSDGRIEKIEKIITSTISTSDFKKGTVLHVRFN